MSDKECKFRLSRKQIKFTLNLMSSEQETPTWLSSHKSKLQDTINKDKEYTYNVFILYKFKAVKLKHLKSSH